METNKYPTIPKRTMKIIKSQERISKDTAITSSSRHVVDLFESKDPEHKYFVRNSGFWAFHSDVNYMAVFRAGLLFKTRVARIIYADIPSSLGGLYITTFRGCPANITHDEIWEAYSRGREEIPRRAKESLLAQVEADQIADHRAEVG